MFASTAAGAADATSSELPTAADAAWSDARNDSLAAAAAVTVTAVAAPVGAAPRARVTRAAGASESVLLRVLPGAHDSSLSLPLPESPEIARRRLFRFPD